MPTTPTGTTYTVHTSTTPDGGDCYWYMDDTRSPGTGTPLFLFIHGSGGWADQFLTPVYATLRNWLIDNGWAVAEGSPGGAQNWAGPDAQTGYQHIVQWVDSQINVTGIAILGNSMGGLSAYWQATKSWYADRVLGVMIHQGTTDLAFRYSQTLDGNTINAAYGMGETKDEAEFAIVSAGHDPMTFDESLWGDKIVMQTWGEEDTTVRPVHHVLPWLDKYREHCGELWERPQPGQGHALEIDDQQAYFPFLEHITAEPAPEPGQPRGLQVITGMYLIGSGGQLFPAQPA